ncbi:hypothetical protein HanIR_Chr03g0133151 [Helianthus annuus]|nr:hypothetical protein HanIR_Chr03g0133151 [Helianthus annuus]
MNSLFFYVQDLLLRYVCKNWIRVQSRHHIFPSLLKITKHSYIPPNFLYFI